jgi:hypothetical protein
MEQQIWLLARGLQERVYCIAMRVSGFIPKTTVLSAKRGVAHQDVSVQHL